MSKRLTEDDLFAPEESSLFEKPGIGGGLQSCWKILIIDDEPDIHEVTKLALGHFEFEGRNLEFLHAYSGEEAKALLHEHSDIAVALIDVVMETEHSGLGLVKYIRETAGNQLIRLILRTGQPGQAPERTVIREYDINDYKEKTELSSQKLYTTIYTSLRSYRDLQALHANRKGLERVLQASAEVFKTKKFNQFINGVLDQLIAVLYLENDSMYLKCNCIALETRDQDLSILAGTGNFSELVGHDADSSLPVEISDIINRALKQKQHISDGMYHAAYFSPVTGQDNVLFFTTQRELSNDDFEFIKMFCQNVAIAYKNVLLDREVEETQQEIVYMLGEAVETRSKETGSHVRRVAEYCRIIARKAGLSERETDLIALASPLHDFGKIGVPDSVLHKPGKLESEEWELMRKHAELGEQMLGKSKREIMKAASIIAGQHHEHWDGSGYPAGLQGEEIHVFGRITALADVYDALSSRRCYKRAWENNEVLDYIKEKRAQQFDPNLVDILLDSLKEFDKIAAQYPD